MAKLGDVIWSTPIRKSVTALAGMIGAVATAIIAVPPAWSSLGLPEIASKVFVHQQVDPIKITQADTTRAVYQLSITQLEGSLYAAQLDQIKAPSETVTQRIQELQQQIQQVQQKLAAPAK